MSGDSLPTRVGRAQWGDNRFGGLSVMRELAGKASWWRIIARGVAGRDLTMRQCALLDDLAASACAADPRIWPLKAVRIGAAFGHIAPALATGLFATDGLHGPASVTACSALLHAIAEELGDGDDDRLQQLVDRRLEATIRPLPGFGVARRAHDERVVAFARCVDDRDAAELPWWSLLRRIESIAIARRQTPANIAGATAAALLDCGFTTPQSAALATVVMFPSLLANAHEGAAQAPAVLQRLPATAIRYVGPPPRKSPRAG